ncbi:hypothetical protein D8S78_23120 [Natrialba swarupiae]|nr:hypothetical protein [Natrialba swarupiae]
MLSGPIYRGQRLMTANNPIETPSDLAGLDMRLPEVEEWVRIFLSLM